MIHREGELERFLSEDDVAALEKEHGGLLAQPRAFKTTIFMLCVAGESAR